MDTAYIRTAQGECFDLPIDQAWLQFCGENGYRITIQIAGGELTLRRDDWKPTNFPPEIKADSTISFRANLPANLKLIKEQI